MKKKLPDYAFEVRGSGKKTTLFCTFKDKPLTCINGIPLLCLLKDVFMCKLHKER